MAEKIKRGERYEEEIVFALEATCKGLRNASADLMENFARDIHSISHRKTLYTRNNFVYSKYSGTYSSIEDDPRKRISANENGYLIRDASTWTGETAIFLYLPKNIGEPLSGNIDKDFYYSDCMPFVPSDTRDQSIDDIIRKLRPVGASIEYLQNELVDMQRQLVIEVAKEQGRKLGSLSDHRELVDRVGTSFDSAALESFVEACRRFPLSMHGAETGIGIDVSYRKRMGILQKRPDITQKVEMFENLVTLGLWEEKEKRGLQRLLSFDQLKEDVSISLDDPQFVLTVVHKKAVDRTFTNYFLQSV